MKDKFERTVPSGVSASTTLETLKDPEMVASWIPMLTSLEEVEPLRRYGAVFTDSVGPFRLRADLDIDVIISDDRIEVSAAGRDRQIGSRLEFGGTLRTTPAEDSAETCTVRVEGWYEITGKAAQMGAATIRRKAEKIVAEFTSSVESRLSG